MIDDEAAGIAWWNGLDDGQRALWMRLAGNTGRAADAWKLFKRVYPGALRRSVRVLADEKRYGFLADRIEAAPSIMSGQPCISGTRILTRSIWSFHRDGYLVDEILREYPTLTREDVEAAVRYERVAHWNKKTR